MRHALRAIRLNLKHLVEDYLAEAFMVGVILATGMVFIFALAIEEGCVPDRAAAACPPAYAAESAGDCKVGGCGVGGHANATDGAIPGTASVRSAGRHPESAASIPGSRWNSGQPPTSLDENRTGRAAEREVPSAASARRLPRGADAKLAQARLVCSFPPVRQALDMLRLHESVNGTQMVGDGGLAQGWLNQHEGHWNDGCEVLGVAWKWPEDTRDLAKCEMVAVANWMRYARAYLAAGNIEELVRRFRLPSKPYRADNDAYLARVMGGGR